MELHNNLSIQETNELERCEIVIKQGLETFVEVGQALMTIRDKRLYRIKYGTFEDYCRDKWGVSRIHAHRLIESTGVIANLLPIGNIPQTESQARPLTKLEPEIQREAWAQVVEETKGNPQSITAKKVSAIAEEWKPVNEELKQAKKEPLFQADSEKEIIERAKQNKLIHVSHNSGNNEWYTPSRYIESARIVMGGIGLDPATSEIANERVKADCIFTEKTNGLTQVWFGNIWMNPPYSSSLIGDFIEKLQTEEFEQAIVLVNNATETKWGNKLLSIADAVCFHKGRIRYLKPDGTLKDSPLQGQMFAYLGANIKLFIDEFSKYGVCLKAL